MFRQLISSQREIWKKCFKVQRLSSYLPSRMQTSHAIAMCSVRRRSFVCRRRYSAHYRRICTSLVTHDPCLSCPLRQSAGWTWPRLRRIVCRRWFWTQSSRAEGNLLLILKWNAILTVMVAGEPHPWQVASAHCRSGRTRDSQHVKDIPSRIERANHTDFTSWAVSGSRSSHRRTWCAERGLLSRAPIAATKSWYTCFLDFTPSTVIVFYCRLLFWSNKLIFRPGRVARSDGCKMPTSRLAQVFGPIMLGQVEDDDSDLLDQEWQTSDVSFFSPISSWSASLDVLFQVMEKLLEIPRSYWTRFVDVEVGIDCKKDPLGSKFFPMPSLE